MEATTTTTEESTTPPTPTDTKPEPEVYVIWAAGEKRNTYFGKGKSGEAYTITLDRKFDRYVLTIGLEPVKHTGTPEVPGKGTTNELVSLGLRGWYYAKDIKGYAETLEEKISKKSNK